jgi:kynurenine 3-monooxygenase
MSGACWTGQPANILGAGPTGALLAILLRRRGLEVTLYDSRPDPRGVAGESGRSINLALADRGIHALKLAGVYDAIAGTLVPMRGRMIHPQGGSPTLHLYGQRPSEVIYSVSRHVLNQALLDVAHGAHGVTMNFEHRLEDVDFAAGTAQIHDLRRDVRSSMPLATLLASDGAGSVVRRHMSTAGLIEATESDLEHGYKELSIPAAPDGGYRMSRDALHIWPRGNFMLIALPNIDGSFTATLFLAKHGAVSFASLSTPAAIELFLSTHFLDVFQQMPDCVAEFQSHPTGFLGTVHARPWSVRGQACLVGDAAHAIVPFHGQGMNCCFEDCLAFDDCLGRNVTWEAVFDDFFESRKPNTDAIADMAVENYLEMRERVADPRFRLQQNLALELERRHPARFIPRYSMVMFHHEIPYATAQRRGVLQTDILAQLTADAATLADVDHARADRLIMERLPPIGAIEPMQPQSVPT